MFSLPAEFTVLMTLLSSEDEVLVGNAALCLGNCMEVPQVASTLLKTDIVQVLLKLAGGDAQKTAVQLNAGIALGKLCTAEPRYTGVAFLVTFQNEQSRASQGVVLWLGLCPTEPCGEPGSPAASHRESCWVPVVPLRKKPTSLSELGSPRAPSEREDFFYLTGICSVYSLPLSPLHSTSSLSIPLPHSPSFSRPLSLPPLPLPPLSHHFCSLSPPLLFQKKLDLSLHFCFAQDLSLWENFRGR